MKTFLNLFVMLVLSTYALGQQKLEMTVNGFETITLQSPDKPMEKRIEAAKAWAATYHKKTYDVYDVTDHSLAIDGWIDNGFFYRHLGERYDSNIVYTLLVDFNQDQTYTLQFMVKEVYARQALTKTTIADFYTPEGQLKQDFEAVKPSLEQTANRVVNSFARFIAN